MRQYLLCILFLSSCSENYDFNIIHFHDGTVNIVESDSILLYENLAILTEHPDVDIILAGHTNSVGDDRDNLILSNMRALTIQSWLIANNVDEDRMTPVGYGETIPVADNRTADGRALNDRVEFKCQQAQTR